MLCEKFNEIANGSGLPENHYLRSVEFAAGSKKTEKFLVSGTQIELEASQDAI